MKKTRLRAGLIGVGSMGSNHLRILSRLEGIDFIGAVDPVNSSVIQTNGVESYNSIEQLIGQGLDYCVISTPSGTHCELALVLLNANIGMLIEKPLAINQSEVKKILSHPNCNQLISGVGHVERFNPAILKGKEILDSGILGEIYQVSTHRLGPPLTRNIDTGVLLDLATHDIDLVHWLFSSEYQEICAQIDFKRHGSNEDYAHISGRLSNGIIITHTLSWLNPIKVRNIAILGANGELKIDTLNSKVTFSDFNFHSAIQRELEYLSGGRMGGVVSYAFERKEPLLMQHENFRDAQLGGEALFTSLPEAARVIGVLQKVNENVTNK